eukprot:CAMPEP_0196780522 /NCGR_PEP_ID=MMETSP1104-20130614/7940_1 /TAXON_ID=33652 /ORGANISM="Cafeteria sp., Strain Caron Lab Isolate" /LENGTH=583 /DNA_ID=CAMNT_0042150733 /DNA_START=38 /DNA_END=1789 /DNA_ORIENTATION=-
MSHYMQPGIILLRDGTDSSQGKPQLVSNINACQAVADVVRTTLGPRGMDKLIYTDRSATVSNDGASIMKLLDVVHPAARTMVDIAQSQDAEIGDGTTTVVLVAGSLLKEAKAFVEEDIHPQVIIKGFRLATTIAIDKLHEVAIALDETDPDARRKLLERCAGTSLNSKLIAPYKAFFAPMVVDAVTTLEDDLDLGMIGVKKVTGGSVTDSFLVRGVAFKKTFSYAGFEQQPKHFDHPKILLLNVELELKSEKENAEVRIDDPDKYQAIVDAEWQIIYSKLEKCVASGAQVILSRLPIGDLATQYFADRGLFCAGRVAEDDMRRVARATGGRVQTSVEDLNETVLGTCGVFHEQQIGAERYNVFSECTEAKSATIVLRGGAKQFVEESHRSIHDALMIVKRAMKSNKVVAGGGAIEMELSRLVKEFARTIEGKLQVVINGFAKALEVIPRQLAENAGFDSTDIMNLLRQKHYRDPEGGKHFGVDIDEEGICNTYEKHVWEPFLSKVNSLSSASEAACLVLSVDETVRNPQSEQAQMQQKGLGGGGAPISQAMGGAGLKGMAGAMGGAGGGRGRGMRVMRGRGGR